MKERTIRTLERLLATPPLPTDETETHAWARDVDLALDLLTGALVFDGYAERIPLAGQRCAFDFRRREVATK